MPDLWLVDGWQQRLGIQDRLYPVIHGKNFVIAGLDCAVVTNFTSGGFSSVIAVTLMTRAGLDVHPTDFIRELFSDLKGSR
ncbi:MAG: hypothetical protein ABIU05_00645 [Nitrospirales bacterium]